MIYTNETEIRVHTLKRGSNDGYQDRNYGVVSLIYTNPEDFTVMERPLIIKHKGKTVYLDEDFETVIIKHQHPKDRDTNLVMLGYNKNEEDFFVEKYFTEFV